MLITPIILLNGEVLRGLPYPLVPLDVLVLATLRTSLVRCVAPFTALLVPLRLFRDPLGGHCPQIEFYPFNPVHLLLAGGIKFFLEFESREAVLKISYFMFGANVCLP